MHKLGFYLSASALLLAGCGKSSDPAPTPAGSAAPAATSAAAPAPTASAAAAAPADTSAYSIVLEAPDGMGIKGMKGGAILSVSNLFLPLGEGPLVQDPAFLKGIKKQDSGAPAGGEWPKSAWIEATDAEGKTKMYKWFDSLGGRWEPQEILREGESLLDIGVVGESVVAAIAMPSNDIRFFLAGGKGGVLPAPAGVKKAEAPAGEGGEAVPSDTPPEEDKSCKVKMSPTAQLRLAGTKAGEAFAAGFECKDAGGSGAPIVERWEAKKARGTVETLPAPATGSLSLGGVVALSGTDAWVYGNAGDAPYLAHWDGKAWALEKAPFQKAIGAMVAADDGALFVAAKDGLYTKKSGGAWEAVALPKAAEGFEPTGVYARTSSDVWVSGKAGGKWLLLRSAKVDKPVVMPSGKAVTDTLTSNFRYIATPLCVKPYAHLFSVGPSATPIPKEFPAVKKSFEGKKFDGAKLVVEDDGRSLYVGAKAANIEQAEAIVKAFVEANPKMTPRVFCHDPQVKKDVDWP